MAGPHRRELRSSAIAKDTHAGLACERARKQCLARTWRAYEQDAASGRDAKRGVLFRIDEHVHGLAQGGDRVVEASHILKRCSPLLEWDIPSLAERLSCWLRGEQERGEERGEAVHAD
jgi:hypothetical protein